MRAQAGEELAAHQCAHSLEPTQAVLQLVQLFPVRVADRHGDERT